MEVLFQFPSDYDDLLGRSVSCKIVSGIVGNSYTYYTKNRGVYLKNFESYIPSSTNPVIV
jgi:hypothetical protein